MNQVVSTNPNPPKVPELNTDSYGKVAESVKVLFGWANRLNGFLNQYLTQLAQSNNTGLSTFGVNLASASTIKVTDSLHHVTGTAAINTIQIPPNFNGGPIWLVADGLWTITTAGNVARAVTPALHQCICLVYDPKNSLRKFYPTI